jgi:hypothetical protein
LGGGLLVITIGGVALLQYIIYLFAWALNIFSLSPT